MTVTRVVDGDTLKIEYQNGTADTVRLLGVDTPEVHSDVSPEEWEGVPDTEAARTCLEGYGSDASQFATDRLDGRTVTVKLDSAADTRGYYGRLLGYVLVDGTNFNQLLLERGYARVYDSTFTQSDTFYAAEADAQAAERGAWSCRDVATRTATPSDGTEGVAIADIQADAPGDEYENLNGEYITLTNRGSEPVDLSGWTVSEGDGVIYTIPDGFTLEAGASVSIHTGSGTDSSTDLYWGLDRPVWNNNGDTATLRDASGTEVDVLSYD